jgi:hypothetical protein
MNHKTTLDGIAIIFRQEGLDPEQPVPEDKAGIIRLRLDQAEYGKIDPTGKTAQEIANLILNLNHGKEVK